MGLLDDGGQVKRREKANERCNHQEHERIISTSLTNT